MTPSSASTSRQLHASRVTLAVPRTFWWWAREHAVRRKRERVAVSPDAARRLTLALVPPAALTLLDADVLLLVDGARSYNESRPLDERMKYVRAESYVLPHVVTTTHA